MSETEIAGFFRRNACGYETEIVRVVIAYDMSDRHQTLRKLEDKLQKRQSYRLKGSDDNCPNILRLDETIAGLKEEAVKKLENARKKGSGTAYVVLRRQASQRAAIQRWSHWCGFLGNNWARAFGQQGKKFEKFRGTHVLAVERAPNPTDILWRNAGVTFWKYFRSRVVIFISTTFLLAIATGVTFSLILVQHYIEDKASGRAADVAKDHAAAGSSLTNAIDAGQRERTS